MKQKPTRRAKEQLAALSRENISTRFRQFQIEGAKPLVEILGWAEKSKTGKSYRYDWEMIHVAWMQFPAPDLRSFCKMFGVSYAAITRPERQAQFNVRDKQQQLQADLSVDFTRRVAQTILTTMQQHGTNAEQMRSTLASLHSAVNAQALLLRARMVKEKSDGTAIANPALRNSELKILSEVAKNIASTMKELVFLDAAIPESNKHDHIADEPTPVLARVDRGQRTG